ncbi:MAG: hypothetical protein JWM99_3340 [Verrucomicrobiales bacterium]|nr:hypothetical protein [Verrucomicrobiales bacterium]
MKQKALSICALSLLLLTACWQKSVYPFYKEKDVIFEPLLLGTWTEPDKKAEEAATWTFTRGEKESLYRIAIHDGETKLDFDGRLFKLGDKQFLDLYSRQRSISEMPAHHLVKIRSTGSSFDLQILSLDWTRDWLRAHPSEIAHIYAADPEHPDDVTKGEIILTAGTDLLQKFVHDHLDATGFFDGQSTFKKVENK